MDLETLEDAVDKARLRMWTEYGNQLGLAFTGEFTPFLAEALGLGQPTAEGPQPPINIVGISAEIAADESMLDEPTMDSHDFVVDRGGKDCITCGKSESKGDHTVSEG